VNFIRPSRLPQAYEQKPPITLLPRVSLTGFRKKKLLILDLNGLLADINQDYHNSHMADAKVRGKIGEFTCTIIHYYPLQNIVLECIEDQRISHHILLQ
jgi:hypothetical protein